MPSPCEQESNINDIKIFMRELAVEMKELVRELRASAVEDRELRTRMESAEKDVTVLYKRMRRMEDDVVQGINESIGVMEGWKNRVQGGFMILMITPSIISVISALIAWFSVHDGP